MLSRASIYQIPSKIGVREGFSDSQCSLKTGAGENSSLTPILHVDLNQGCCAARLLRMA